MFELLLPFPTTGWHGRYCFCCFHCSILPDQSLQGLNRQSKGKAMLMGPHLMRFSIDTLPTGIEQTNSLGLCISIDNGRNPSRSFLRFLSRQSKRFKNTKIVLTLGFIGKGTVSHEICEPGITPHQSQNRASGLLTRPHPEHRTRLPLSFGKKSVQLVISDFRKKL